MRRFAYIALTLAFIVACVVLPAQAAVVLELGSSGANVVKVQKRLIQYDYLDGVADGKYGAATQAAVRLFQRRNGLKVDGKVGPSTAAALGVTLSSSGGGTKTASTTSASITSSDHRLLAKLVYAEARGEPYKGQVAVAAVVLNRVRSSSFPNTISGVIYQSGAFSCIDDGQFWEPVSDSAFRAAREAMAGSDPSGGAIYYFNPAKATSKWIWSRPLIVVIGDHRFCS